MLINASRYASLAALLCVLLALLLYFGRRHHRLLSALSVPFPLFSATALRIYAAAAFLVLAYCGGVRVSDRWFQYRAESCLRDIQALEPRKSTWQDAERIHAKYAKWATTTASCSAASCDLNIALDHWYEFMGSHDGRYGLGAKYLKARGIRRRPLGSYLGNGAHSWRHGVGHGLRCDGTRPGKLCTIRVG